MPWSEQTPEMLPPLSPTEEFRAHSWSLDGKWLAGDRRDPSGTFKGIAIYNFDARSYQNLTDSGERPAWLNDNRRLLFTDRDAIRLVDRETKQVRDVLSAAPHSVWTPRLSKDNRWLVYSLRSSEADIWLITLQP